MKITVKARKVQNPVNSVIGYASVTFEDFIKDEPFVFVIRNIQIIKNKDGVLFLGFPTRRDSKAESGYSNIAFPATKESRDYMTKLILEAYESAE